MRVGSLVAVLLVASCQQPGPAPPAEPPAVPRAAAIAHGGLGSRPGSLDSPRRAVAAALAVLERGGDALDAAVAGVAVLEDDPLTNAGTGSYVRLDGVTVQMDAAVMDSSGRFGAVAVIEGVKNPVKIARAVVDTPHRLLAGDGAVRFARAMGFPAHDPTTPARLARAAELVDKLRRRDPSLPAAWRTFDYLRAWNFARSPAEAGLAPGELGGDTVGVVVRDAGGRYAAALSTGGWTIAMHGRVGDVPILGAGLYAGAGGAVACTGAGERIMDAGVAREVHRWLAAGVPAGEAAERAKALTGGKDLGLLVIDAGELAAASTQPMAWAGRELGSDAWVGTP